MIRNDESAGKDAQQAYKDAEQEIMMQKRLEQQELMRSERCLDFDAREMDEYCSQSSGDEQEELKA